MAPFYISRKNYDKESSEKILQSCDAIIAEMGAEIHDDLIQRLTILRLSLDRLEKSISNPEEADEIFISIKTDFKEIINSVRRTSRRLLPVQMDFNTFQDGIEILCQNLEKPGI